MNRKFALWAVALAVILVAQAAPRRRGSGRREIHRGKTRRFRGRGDRRDGRCHRGIEVTGTLSPKYQAEMKSEYAAWWRRST